MPEQLVAKIHRIIPEHQLNSWELDELQERLQPLAPDLLETVLSQVPVIWPVSHSLCFAFLEQLDHGLTCLSAEQLPDWVKRILDIYEAHGLHAARLFMEDVHANYVCRIQGADGLEFPKVSGRLLPYVRGLSGRPLQLESSPDVRTDTGAIFLPHRISFFANDKDNFFVYKLLATYQWALLRMDLYVQKQSGLKELESFLAGFSNPTLAGQWYHLLQTIRATRFLHEYFPGLMRDGRPFFDSIRRKRPIPGTFPPSDQGLELGYRWLLDYCLEPSPPHSHRIPFEEILRIPLKDDCSIRDLFDATRRLVTELDGRVEDDITVEPLPFQGTFNPREARLARMARREADKQQFIKALAAILPPAAPADATKSMESTPREKQANITEKGATVMVLSPSESNNDDQETGYENDPRHICLDDEHLDLPKELKDLADAIRDDLGSLPSLYISSASRMSGGRGNIPGRLNQEDNTQPLQGGLLYNEWDYRRQGFRKNWCRVVEKSVQPAKGTFIASTLETYRGQLIQLRRQFEMMRTGHCFVKRQKEGDDIDLDALTEAHADLAAGLSPGERLFIRLQRDERDIAALFLVDMSSSTEGWVGKALKESLVLLSEALHRLGDRYAIYGFSGMRRTRSEIFYIKGFDERYDETIQDRISAITPMEYTRMGPPIRHFTKALSEIDARVKLMILLTDGKPEDYDDYKGEYAIEDTRHALQEAKAAGVHPFCISIDRQAHDYLAHLFGRVNYVFIDDVGKLPLQVPAIYRILTT